MVRSQAVINSVLFGAALNVMGSIAATAADYPEAMRGSFPSDWSSPEMENPISFELGMRYWYSMGAHKLTNGGNTYTANDTSHVLEGHFRINDASTNSYAKGQLGYAAVIAGNYSTWTSGGEQAIQGGTLGYAGADLGFLPFGTDSFRFGGFAGYQYSNDSPNMDRAGFTTSGGGGDSRPNNIEFHSLRLGVVGKADIADMVDLNVEAAAIPYARMGGTYGTFASGAFTSGGTNYVQGSAATLEGNLYGAAGEVMLGVHPTQNLTLRVGGRASYLTGPATLYFTAREDGTPANQQNFFSAITELSFLRYGLLAEITGSFQ